MIDVARKDKLRMARLLHGRLPFTSRPITATADDIDALLNYLESQGYSILSRQIIVELNKAAAVALEPHLRHVLATPDRSVLRQYVTDALT